jgi:glycosyltransferase involved in cell wall biosynthesis
VARVAMLLGNPFTHDARVDREARTLVSLGHEVTVFCVAKEGLPAGETRAGVRIVRVPRPGWLGWTGPLRLVPLLRYFSRYEFLARAAEPWKPAVVHGHDLELLLPAARLAERLGVPHVHDDHEVGVEKLPAQTPTWLRGPKRWVLDLYTLRLIARAERLQRAWFPRAAAVITVSEGCAATLAPYGAKPVVLRNVPEWRDLPPDPRLRERAGLPPRTRIALSQGTMTEATAPDVCVSAARFLPEGWAVVFLGVTWMRPLLEEQARKEGLSDRVRFLDAVPPEELPGFTRAADVGLTPLRVRNAAERHGLANKLFEYLQAGLPIVTTDGCAQGKLVLEEDAGVALKSLDPRAMAEAIVALGALPRPERERRSERLRALARERYCWQVESRALADTYARVLARP